MASNEQQQYKITRAAVTSNNVNGEVDISASILELTLYEDIEKPYVTGKVAVSDDTALYDIIDFRGTQRLNIVMASEDESLEPVMDRTFLMYNIDDIKKSTNAGDASVYIFALIDEHAVIGEATKISRTVRGSLEEELQRICLQDLGKDVDLSYMTPSVQSEFKINIPYLNAIDAIEWLRGRATTENGMPFFLYASIHDERLRIGNLEVMLQQQAWNKQVPYLYSPSNTNNAEDMSSLEKTMVVQGMRATKLQNTRAQMLTGGIGSTYNNLNLATGRTTSIRFDITKLLARMTEENIIPSGKSQNVYDELFTTSLGEALHDMDAMMFHTVTSQGTYDTFKSYHDELDGPRFLKKIENLAVRNMLYKNMFDVTVPGAGFIISKASVGDIVSINVQRDDNDPNSEEKLDQLRSGDFLIYNVRHTFRNTRHNVAMTVCKLTRG